MNSTYSLGAKQIDANKFHKTKLLLKIYRDVVWRMEDALHDVNETAYSFGGRRISELIDFLSFGIEYFDSSRDKKAIEERFMSIVESKDMIEIIDKALVKLKSHPDFGEVYFNIIHANYICKDKMTYGEILDKLHISESTYFRYKKNAINLLSVILWGYILPSLRDVWCYNMVAENGDIYNKNQRSHSTLINSSLESCLQSQVNHF